MRKSFAGLLCILCCFFLPASCSQPEKSAGDHVDMALEQLGRPLGEAYRALGLPGDPGDAAEVFYLYAEDCTEVLGKQMNMAVVHLGKGEEDKELTEEKTNSVEYLALLDGDYAYPLRLYQALQEAYGEPEPATGARPFSMATEASIEAMKQGERYAVCWEKENYVIELSVSAGVSSGEAMGSVTLEIRESNELLGYPSVSAAEDTGVW